LPPALREVHCHENKQVRDAVILSSAMVILVVIAVFYYLQSTGYGKQPAPPRPPTNAATPAGNHVATAPGAPGQTRPNTAGTPANGNTAAPGTPGTLGAPAAPVAVVPAPQDRNLWTGFHHRRISVKWPPKRSATHFTIC